MPGLSLSLSCRVEQYCPAPPEATTGIRGIKAADEVLKNYGTSGILIGGLAKALWWNRPDQSLAKRKDVDVVVLSHEYKHHPETFEAGIDWWTSESPDEAFSNGYYVSLLIKMQLHPSFVFLRPGLYLCPWQILYRLSKVETEELGEGKIFRPPCNLHHFKPKVPQLYEQELVYSWAHLTRH